MVIVDEKAALNCGFVAYPQLSGLVTTNTFIDRKQVVREPRALNPVFNLEMKS
jgi:hypothetical protein